MWRGTMPPPKYAPDSTGTDRLTLLVTDTAIGVEDLEFDSRAGQIKHSVANGSPPLRCFLGSVLSKR